MKVTQRRFVLLFFAGVLLSACHQPQQAPKPQASAQAAPERMLNEGEVRAKYRSCSDGYYSGPQPGKARYTKDDYYWVVTPEFAQRYCMPPEFVSTELKGALAIAYKPVQEGAENCGFGGNKEACSRHTAHGFEIYFDSAISIEHVSDTKYNYRAFYMLPHSKHLIGPNENQIETPAQHEAWLKDRPGAQNRFRITGWGIEGVKGDKVVWPISACGEVQYIDSILPGINFLSLECRMGDFNNSRMQRAGATRFILGLMKNNDQGEDEGRPVNAFAHVIDMPERLSQQVQAVDKQGAEAFKQLLRQVLPEAYGKE